MQNLALVPILFVYYPIIQRLLRQPPQIYQVLNLLDTWCVCSIESGLQHVVTIMAISWLLFTCNCLQGFFHSVQSSFALHGRFWSIKVSGKLSTYPSLKLTLTLTSHQGQNDGLGWGRWTVYQKRKSVRRFHDPLPLSAHPVSFKKHHVWTLKPSILGHLAKMPRRVRRWFPPIYKHFGVGRGGGRQFTDIALHFPTLLNSIVHLHHNLANAVYHAENYINLVELLISDKADVITILVHFLLP